MGQIGPLSLHQEHIAHMQSGGYQIVGNIFLAHLTVRRASATLHAQHVDAEALAQVGISNSQSGKIGSRHHNNLGQPQVVEINLHVLHLPQVVILRKPFNLLLITHYI